MYVLAYCGAASVRCRIIMLKFLFLFWCSCSCLYDVLHAGLSVTAIHEFNLGLVETTVQIGLFGGDQENHGLVDRLGMSIVKWILLEWIVYFRVRMILWPCSGQGRRVNIVPAGTVYTSCVGSTPRPDVGYVMNNRSLLLMFVRLTSSSLLRSDCLEDQSNLS